LELHEYFSFNFLVNTIITTSKNRTPDILKYNFVYVDFQQELYKHKLPKLIVEKPSKNNVTKVYCVKCDLIFESREKFEKHFDRHSSNVTCEVCPIDTVVSKFVNMFKRRSSRNLE